MDSFYYSVWKKTNKTHDQWSHEQNGQQKHTHAHKIHKDNQVHNVKVVKWERHNAFI